MSARLTLALESGDLVLPDGGAIVVIHPRSDFDLSALPKDRVRIIQPFAPDHAFFQAAGFNCTPDPEPLENEVWAASIVALPRAKALARDVITLALAKTEGPVTIDGLKTDGIDGIFRDLRRVCDVSAPLSKAHGKLFWMAGRTPIPDAWQTKAHAQPAGFTTQPGVFSADGVDPGSALLGDALPQKLGQRIGDLGAGWGYLAHRILQGRDTLKTLDLVEADHTALTCARANVTDPRARFHWHDARTWQPADRLDTVVMNPPFHQGRKADADLGRAFIEAAHRMLVPSGALFMVANRHLAYEQTLRDLFANVEEITGDNRFKVIRAAKPRRPGRK